jgi:hypothetical protein
VRDRGADGKDDPGGGLRLSHASGVVVPPSALRSSSRDCAAKPQNDREPSGLPPTRRGDPGGAENETASRVAGPLSHALRSVSLYRAASQQNE